MRSTANQAISKAGYQSLSEQTTISMFCPHLSFAASPWLHSLQCNSHPYRRSTLIQMIHALLGCVIYFLSAIHTRFTCLLDWLTPKIPLLLWESSRSSLLKLCIVKYFDFMKLLSCMCCKCTHALKTDFFVSSQTRKKEWAVSTGLIDVVAQCKDTENGIVHFSVGSNRDWHWKS